MNKLFLFTVVMLASSVGVVSAQQHSYMIIVGENADSSDMSTAENVAWYLGTIDINATIVNDNEFVDDMTSAIISIGGSCVNSYSAKLLNVDYPTCGDEFSSAVDVERGQFIVNAYSISNGRMAIVDAGYAAEDTMRGATFIEDSSNMMSLRKDNFSIIKGEPYEPVKHYVNIQYGDFYPSALIINAGDTVMWINNEANATNTVTSDSGNELSSGELGYKDSYSHMFNETGYYAYHSEGNSQFDGYVLVK